MGSKLPERGTAEFYRHEAVRISRLAESVVNPSLRLEMLDIAAGFLKLAEHAIVSNAAREENPAAAKSA
jgi:hypothetical protein